MKTTYATAIVSQIKKPAIRNWKLSLARSGKMLAMLWHDEKDNNSS